jgi:hypothetical protein
VGDKYASEDLACAELLSSKIGRPLFVSISALNERAQGEVPDTVRLSLDLDRTLEHILVHIQREG